MDHGQLGMVADKGQWVCADTRLNACGQVAQLRRRQRPLTPFRSLGTNLLATHSPRNRALAGLHMALAGGITGSNMDILREAACRRQCPSCPRRGADGSGHHVFGVSGTTRVAKRDHPTGRLQLGLAPLLESKSLSAFAEAASVLTYEDCIHA